MYPVSLMEVLWIGAAFALGLLGRQLGLPPLAGYLAAGLVLHGFGVESGELLNSVAHIGVLLLLFSVGLKLDLRGLLRGGILGTALIHLAVTGGLLGLAIAAITGIDWRAALMVGVALGFSSTVLAAKILEQRREFRAFHGRVAVGILIVQDLVAVGILSFSGGHVPSPLALLLLGIPLLRPVLHRVLEISGHDELLVLYGLLLALVGGFVFEQVGLSSELGALLLGASLSGHSRAIELFKALWGIKEAFLVAFFLQISLIGWPTEAGLFYLALLILILPLKSVLFFMLLLLFRLRARSAFLAGLSLTSYSEFALICVAAGVETGWLSPDWLVVLALATAISFMLTAPVNRVAHALYARWETRLIRYEKATRHPDEQPLLLGKSRFLVMGMGRSGTAAYDFLTQHGRRVAGMDSDPIKTARHQQAGRRVMFADGEDPGLWHNLDLSGVRAVLLTMADAEASRLTARQLRAHGFTGVIGATSPHHDDDDALLEAGADMTFSINEEAGVGLAEHVIEALPPRPAN